MGPFQPKVFTLCRRKKKVNGIQGSDMDDGQLLSIFDNLPRMLGSALFPSKLCTVELLAGCEHSPEGDRCNSGFVLEMNTAQARNLQDQLL